MGDKYIIVQVGSPDSLGEGHVAYSYQLYERCRDFNHEWYELILHLRNEPVILGTARRRLEELNGSEEAHQEQGDRKGAEGRAQ